MLLPVWRRALPGMGCAARTRGLSGVPHDPVGALVPHTLRSPLVGAGAGPLAGLSFVLKDLYDIAGRKTGNGNPTVLELAAPAARSSSVVTHLLAAGAVSGLPRHP